MKLAGQTTIVTGAGRGIGRAMALAQAGEGARVALVSRTSSEIDAVTEQIVDAGGRAKAYALDVTDMAEVEKAFAAIADNLGPIDLLTNNAGAFGGIGPVWDVDPEVWWRDVETNVRGTFHCCRAVLPRMLERKRGRIINLTGGGTATSFPYGSGYATSKAGLLRFTECVSDTLVGTGVRVFALDPGLVRTTMTEHLMSSEAGRTYLSGVPENFANKADVPPDYAAHLTVEIGSGRFDKLAGRMFIAALGDIDLKDPEIARIVREDLRSLRVNGLKDLRGTVA